MDPAARIPMLDLRRQQQTIHAELVEVILQTVDEARYLSTETVTPFEEELARYCGRKHAVGVASGSSALHLSLLAAGIGPGDEVVTVPNSFFATAEAILQVGARPVFVDVDARTHLMALDRLADVLTSRTCAILPVHLFGNVVDVGDLTGLLRDLGRDDVIVIEDCAHAMGARQGGRPVPLGAIGAFSFNPTKNIGALGDAGAVVTDDPALAERVRLLRDHGRAEKNSHLVAGFNARLDRLNDRVLALKLRYLDAWNCCRREIAARYDAALRGIDGIEPVTPRAGVQSAYHQYVTCAPGRDQLREHLADRGIDTAIHYPRLIPEQEPLRELGYSADDVPVARRLNREILSLPCYPELTELEVERVISAVIEGVDAQRATAPRRDTAAR